MKVEDYLIALDAEPDTCYVWHDKTENKYPIHKHKKGQLTYVEGGMAFFYSREKSYFLPSRHFVWVPPGMEHYFELRYPASVVRSIYFNFEGIEENDFYFKMGIYPVNNLLWEMILFTEKWKGDIGKDSQAYHFLITLKNILPEISQHPLPIAVPTTENERLRPVLIFIHRNISENLTISNVAARFGFSDRNLSRMFRADLDISFFQYLKLLRIVKAMEMLLQTKQTVSEIAYATGYDSISAFSNTFFQLTGRRPTDFRNL
ncbi:AraC-type DNA-binding protein [Pseudarcicella hirudinis]|uniref:AraC-type DNA-binding protein n=1 Tax=Pseudarcicella hirudinis TaxID=1079859 RepID=A0A1I5NZ68_9BACT|nr:AraC family transcriptional regulator [Pseudarcicella hirudinis]SFP27063.1 AraC-type DNA-binding protein [Pseudarcicella hirudinis]